LNNYGLEKVTEGHSNWYHSKAWVRFPVRLQLTIAVSLTVSELFGVKE